MEPHGIKFVAFREGSTLGILLAALQANEKWGAHAEAVDLMSNMNVPRGWVTNIALTGKPLSADDAAAIVDSIRHARPLEDRARGGQFPGWIKWMLVAIVLGMVALVLLGHYCGGAR